MILDFHAPQEVLRERVVKRLARADDASEADLAVLEHQFAVREPLTPAEMAAAFAVDATAPVSHDMWRPLIERLRRSTRGKAPAPLARAAHRADGKLA
jgi:predicted kinase